MSVCVSGVRVLHACPSRPVNLSIPSGHLSACMSECVCMWTLSRSTILPHTLSCEKSINFDTQRFCGIISSSMYRSHNARHTMASSTSIDSVHVFAYCVRKLQLCQWQHTLKHMHARIHTHQTRKWQIEIHVLWRRIITRTVWRLIHSNAVTDRFNSNACIVCM